MNIQDFPKNPYPGQVFWDMKSKIVFEYWTPDEFCESAGIKPKWIIPSYESELVSGLFSKNGKVRYLSYNKLIDIYKYTDQQIKLLMKELRME